MTAASPFAPRPRRPATLATLLWLFLATALAGGLAVALYLISPASAGRPGAVYARDEVYAFRHLTIDRPYFRAQVDYGRLVPVYAGQDVQGVVIFGRGAYTFRPPPPFSQKMEADIGWAAIEDDFESIYLPCDYTEMDEMRYRAQSTQVTEPKTLARAQAVLEEDLEELAPALPFGLARLFLFRPVSFLAYVHGRQYGEVRYTEGPEVRLAFVSLGGKEVSFPNPAGELGPGALRLASTPAHLPVTLGIFVSNFLLLMLLVGVATLDLQHAPPWLGGGRRRPTIHEAVLLAGLLLVEISHWVTARACLLEPETAYITYALFGALILWFARSEGWGLKRLGIDRRYLGRSLGLGVGLGVVATAALTLSYPQGLIVAGPGTVALRMASSLLGAGLVKTFYQQGFLQTTLQRWLGGWPGLFATAAAAGLAYGIPALLTAGPGQPLADLFQPLVVIPATTLLVGYIFWRTQNLAGGIVARGVLDLLPRLFRF
ncbi:MAG: hypothetical protein K6T75_06455 [Acetobacteraceae bacterium]|nr:hypothetical protein [Acetobacteraceae bacterium]